MTQTITDLAIQKKNPGRIDIYLDDHYGFTVNLMDAAGLQKGQQLDDRTIARYQELSTRQQAYQDAVRYLGYQPRSRQEIVRKLHRNGFTEAAIRSAVNRLLKEGLLDDQQLARGWVENRNRFKPRSKLALRSELNQKGIHSLIIDEVLADIDDAALAKQLVQSRLNRWRRLDRRAFYQKVFSYLQRRGFDRRTANDAYHYGCRLRQDDPNTYR